MKLQSLRAPLLLGIAAFAPILANAQSAAAGEESPSFQPFTRQTVTGQTFESSVRSDRPLLIVFWAVWCPACIEEAPALRRLKTQYGERLRMAGIAAKEGETEEVVRTKARVLRFNYPIIYDGDDSLRASFNIRLIPQLLLVGGDGRVLLRTMDLDSVERKLAELLPPSPRAITRPPKRLPRRMHAKIRAPTPR